jgi:hypothetical protein
MTNKIGACVTDIVSIAQGSGSFEERFGKVEYRIRDLLLDARACTHKITIGDAT